jgi:hypothetical protein
MQQHELHLQGSDAGHHIPFLGLNGYFVPWRKSEKPDGSIRGIWNNRKPNAASCSLYPLRFPLTIFFAETKLLAGRFHRKNVTLAEAFFLLT